MTVTVHTTPVRRDASEAAARRRLLGQVARLEAELAEVFTSSWPRKGLSIPGGPSHAGARLLSLEEAERVRDELVHRVAEARRALAERTAREEESRALVEAMLREPERFKWVRVRNEDIGEPGCKTWEVRPRLGPLGMLMNWWRVRISSGCPLARGAAAEAGAQAQELSGNAQPRPGHLRSCASDFCCWPPWSPPWG